MSQNPATDARTNLTGLAPRVTPFPPLLLEVRGLHVHRGPQPVLKDVSFDLRAGEFVAVLGRSGAGKTTLMHTLGGLVESSAGAVRWPGSDEGNNGSRPSVSRRAVLFQHYRLVPQLSAITNVMCGRLGDYPWWRTLAGFPAEDRLRAKTTLESLGLQGKCMKSSRRLSGGEQQRVAIARALIQEPRLLLADEPVASLDAETANEVMQLLQMLNRERGLTLLCVLHDLEMAERFAQRVLLIDAGTIVYDGPSENLQKIVRDRLQWKTLL